jgi:hypothetical protein
MMLCHQYEVISCGLGSAILQIYYKGAIVFLFCRKKENSNSLCGPLPCRQAGLRLLSVLCVKNFIK